MKNMKRSVALVVAIALLIGCAAGGTMAWLTMKTPDVVNTFTTSDVSITLTETDAIKDRSGNWVNEYKMVPGATNKSYGINVARLAHLPEELLVRAKEILNAKESQGNVIVTSKVISTNETKKVSLPSYVSELEKLNPLEMTPLEALTYLFELQKKVKEGK